MTFASSVKKKITHWSRPEGEEIIVTDKLHWMAWSNMDADALRCV